MSIHAREAHYGAELQLIASTTAACMQHLQAQNIC